MTYPNSIVNYAQPENGAGLLFLHLLEPHGMAEDYVALFRDLQRRRHPERAGAARQAAVTLPDDVLSFR